MKKHKVKPRWGCKFICFIGADGNTFIVTDRYYRPKAKGAFSRSRTFDLKELISGEEIRLKFTTKVRSTNDASYTKLEILNDVAFNVQTPDMTSKSYVNIVRGTYTQRVATYDYVPASLNIEIKSSDIVYLMRYYDSKTKEITLPFQDFNINSRTEVPNIELIQKKL